MKLKVHEDIRGKFVEVYKSEDVQVSFLTINPGQTRGNHYHRVHYEKFIVIQGRCLISYRKINEDLVYGKYLDAANIEEFIMEPFNVHNICNKTDKECIVLLITDKPFDKNDTDTYKEDV